MDPLDEVLADLRTTDSCYCHCELHAPWGAELSGGDTTGFHFVAEGRSYAFIDNETIALEEGDVILMPLVRPHGVADAPTTRRLSFDTLPLRRLSPNATQVRLGETGERTVIICGGGRVPGLAAHPLLPFLPAYLLVRKRDPATFDPLGHTLESMAHEVKHPGPGSAAIMARLVDLIILQSLRAWLLAQSQTDRGWLTAVRDPQIGRSLSLIHQAPGHEWDVERLAREVGMSRSVFAERFARLVGQTPKLYLTKWRMHVAVCWLAEAKLSLAEIAERLGYGSEAAFSRAFKRHHGRAPGGYRRGGLPFANQAETALGSEQQGPD